MDPFTAMLIISAASKGVSAAGNAIAGNKQRQSEEALSREQLELDRQQGLMNTASNESMADPFRQQLSQAGAAAKLDRLQHASYSPVSVNVPARYAQYKPQVTGGYSYERSPEVRQAAGALKESVLAGRTAPSMTSPDNYGKTATLDLYSGQDPRTDAAFSNGAPNRTTLGAPNAPVLTAITGRQGKAGMADRNNRAKEITQFEAANPGWTVDDLGRVARKASA